MPTVVNPEQFLTQSIDPEQVDIGEPAPGYYDAGRRRLYLPTRARACPVLTYRTVLPDSYPEHVNLGSVPSTALRNCYAIA
eukprot:356090-Rhodomonas_salina.1